MIVPAAISAPSSTVSCAPTGMTKSRMRFSLPPFVCQISMCGWSFFSRSSMTTRWRRPGELVELLAHRLFFHEVHEAHFARRRRR